VLRVRGILMPSRYLWSAALAGLTQMESGGTGPSGGSGKSFNLRATLGLIELPAVPVRGTRQPSFVRTVRRGGGESLFSIVMDSVLEVDPSDSVLEVDFFLILFPLSDLVLSVDFEFVGESVAEVVDDARDN